MLTTVFLAKFLGIVFTSFALGLLFNRDHAKKIAADLVAHPGIALVAGVVPLLLGAFLVLVHNTWAWNWDVIVTIAGWLLFVVGLFRLWCVDVWIDVMKKHKDRVALRAGLIVFVIGILLIYVGFFR